MTPPMALGTTAPDFELPATDGRVVARRDFAGRPLLVAFICNHCPFVKHLREGLAAFGRDLQAEGLGVVAINSNDVEAYPEDAPEKMAEEVALAGYTFPYAFDESQAVARAYGAMCTPDFFLFDAEHKLVYHGQFDGSRPTNDEPVTGADLRAAARATLAGERPVGEPRLSVGCGIKWKPGQEPG